MARFSCWGSSGEARHFRRDSRCSRHTNSPGPHTARCRSATHPACTWTRLTTNNTLIVTPFAFLPIFIHPHGHLESPSSFLLTLIDSSIHLGRHFHSLWSSFPLTLIVVSIHLDRRFCSPWSSFPFTRIVSYVHFYYRHFHSPGPSSSVTLIVISIHPNRLLHSPSSSFPFNFHFIVT